MKAVKISAYVILIMASAALPLWAHHSWPVNSSRLVTVNGTVTDVTWGNPHPMITLEVRTGDGGIEKWLVGGPAINRMEANGWTKTTVKAGDAITGIGYQFADGQKIIRLERVVLADGKELRLYGRQARGSRHADPCGGILQERARSEESHDGRMAAAQEWARGWKDDTDVVAMVK